MKDKTYAIYLTYGIQHEPVIVFDSFAFLGVRFPIVQPFASIAEMPDEFRAWFRDPANTWDVGRPHDLPLVQVTMHGATLRLPQTPAYHLFCPSGLILSSDAADFPAHMREMADARARSWASGYDAYQRAQEGALDRVAGFMD